MKVELFLPFTNFKVNVKDLSATSSRFPGPPGQGKELIVVFNKYYHEKYREHTCMKGADCSQFQIENYNLEIGDVFPGEFCYMWLKEIKGKKPIDLYDEFLPSIIEIVNGLQQLVFE